MKRTKVGIIGCGMISDTYFKAAQKFNIIEVVACADIIPERAVKKTELYGVPNMTKEELLAREDIEIVINLTSPRVHSKIAMDTLNAGKHAYSEKPFGVDAADAAKVMALAKEKGVEDRIIYSSFNHYTLMKLRELKPDAKLGMLFGDIMVKPWEYAAQLPVDYLHPMKMNIYVPGFTEGTAAAGYGVNMWTINDPETMQLCMETDAGIITNYPDVAVALQKK